VRVYAEKADGIPPEQVVGSVGGTSDGYDSSGTPRLMKEPKLLLNDNDAGKPEGIHMMIGRRPSAAFGNSTGDRQMLEYTKAGEGPRLSMLLLHDDPKREYGHGPAAGLPDTKVGAFPQALFDEARSRGWTIISMKDDWKRIFAFEEWWTGASFVLATRALWSHVRALQRPWAAAADAGGCRARLARCGFCGRTADFTRSPHPGACFMSRATSPRRRCAVSLAAGAATSLAALCAVTLLAVAVPGAQAGPGDDAKTTPDDPKAGDVSPIGKVVEAPRNLREFSPAESAVTVDASTANLRELFETLGPDAIEWYQHVQTLSNPMFDGRAPGTDGFELAADYLEHYMKEAGLEPAFPAESDAPAAEGQRSWTSYRQHFDLPGGGLEVRRAEFAVNGAPAGVGLDFIVLGNSGIGEVTAPLTFVGYGLREGRDGYTSFEADRRLDGRIAILFRYEPLDDEGQSLWSDRRFSEFAGLRPKFQELAARGAVGVILVNPTGAKHGKSSLETPESSQFGGEFAIPMIQVTEAFAEKLLTTGTRETRTLLEWRKLADRGEVKTVDLSDDLKVSLGTDLGEKTIRTCNMGGVIHGRGDLANQWVIIGAHFDHVGYGYFGTSPAYRGQLHPGADDNASGTAGLLLLARRLAADAKALPEGASSRSILFLGFTAEESGLHGSRYFVRNPTVSGDATMAMINLDMIGRLRQDELVVSGTGTAENFDAILRPHFEKSGLTIRADPSGRGPSDHANFYGAGIPVVFPFTGLHNDYHTPRDKGYTVNPSGAIKVVDLVEAIASDFATRPDKLVFQKSEGSAGTDRGYGPVRLGVTPAMGGDVANGVLVEAVGEGSSAAEAGIQPGDVLVAWNGEEMTGAASLMENLRKHKPQDEVQIVLMRNNERLVVRVVLKESRRPPQG